MKRTALLAFAALFFVAAEAQATIEPGRLTVVRCNADGSYDCALVDCTGTNWCCK